MADCQVFANLSQNPYYLFILAKQYIPPYMCISDITIFKDLSMNLSQDFMLHVVGFVTGFPEPYFRLFWGWGETPYISKLSIQLI